MKKLLNSSLSFSLFNFFFLVSNCSAQIIAGGWNHSLAVCSDGTVQSWGRGVEGQLGNGIFGPIRQPTPLQVNFGAGVIITAVSGGGAFSLALKNDGTVWSWGNDGLGQLGNNAATVSQSAPVQVASLTGITAIAAGEVHSFALKNDGTVWSWGFDGFGQLGNNAALVQQNTPVQVNFGAGVTITAIAAGEGTGEHCLALKSDSTVWSWGSDGQGQLGDNANYGAAADNKPTPVAVSGLTSITAIAMGGVHSLAVKNDGTVWSWGHDNNYGQLGDDAALVNKPTPVQVAILTGVTAVAAGGAHSLALKNDGTVWSWGADWYGQLGNNVSGLTAQPTPVQALGPLGVGFLTGITAIAAGQMQSLALKNDGTLWSFGSDDFGQLGDNASSGAAADNKSTPVQVSPLCTVTFLPIELLSFTVNCDAASVKINWSTASETNNDYFTVERTQDGLVYTPIAFVNGAGNSTVSVPYSTTDPDPLPGTNYYRLKQTDFNGQHEYFQPTAATCFQGINSINIYPNPASTTVEYVITSSESSEGLVSIIDVLGKTVLKNKLTIQQGINRFSLDISSFSSGSYFIQVKTDTGLYRYQKQLCIK